MPDKELEQTVDVLYQMIMGMEADRRYTQITYGEAGIDGIRRALGQLAYAYGISYDDALNTLIQYRKILNDEHRKDMEEWRNEQKREKS